MQDKKKEIIKVNPGMTIHRNGYTTLSYEFFQKQYQKIYVHKPESFFDKIGIQHISKKRFNIWKRIFLNQKDYCILSNKKLNYVSLDKIKKNIHIYNFYTEDHQLLTLDHIQPDSKGGSYSYDNLNPLLETLNLCRANVRWSKFEKDYKDNKIIFLKSLLEYEKEVYKIYYKYPYITDQGLIDIFSKKYPVCSLDPVFKIIENRKLKR